MGGVLAVNVLVVDEAGASVVLEAGSDVPKWAADQVGEHCFEQSAEDDKSSARKRQTAK